MKILLAVVLSAALIWLNGGHSQNLNKQEVSKAPAAVRQNKPTVEQKVATPQPEIKQAAVVIPTPVAQGCDAYRPLVAKYKWNVEVAMAIMQAESGCNPNAANWSDSHNICMGSFGLFQISCHSGQVYDPQENIRIAWAKYQARGWQPWGAYNSGAYLRYL